MAESTATLGFSPLPGIGVDLAMGACCAVGAQRAATNRGLETIMNVNNSKSAIFRAVIEPIMADGDFANGEATARGKQLMLAWATPASWTVEFDAVIARTRALWDDWRAAKSDLDDALDAFVYGLGDGSEDPEEAWANLERADAAALAAKTMATLNAKAQWELGYALELDAACPPPRSTWNEDEDECEDECDSDVACEAEETPLERARTDALGLALEAARAFELTIPDVIEEAVCALEETEDYNVGILRGAVAVA